MAALAGVLSIAFMLALALVILAAKDRIEGMVWRLRNPPEKLAAERAALERRILHPDWDFYARHLEREVPSTLRLAFEDPNIVTRQNLSLGADGAIRTFAPLDEAGLTETRDWIGRSVVAFAYNDFGDPIHLIPGAGEDDAVYVTYHDGGDSEILAPTVEDFINRLQRAGALAGSSP